MKKFFSIIIPVYNAEKYLYECLNSLNNQTFQNFEVIIIIDGATDNSLNICNEFKEKKTELFNVYEQENRGVSLARNEGIKKVNGEYIIFLDSDDYLETYALYDLYTILINNNIEYLIFNNKILKNNMIRSSKSKFEEKLYNKNGLVSILSELLKTEKINSIWGKIYKSEIIRDNNILFDSRVFMGEDLLFNLEYITKIKNLYIYSNDLYIYRLENANSLTKKYIKDKYEQLKYVNVEMQNLLSVYNNKKILSVVKYLRLKNIYSCFIDLYHVDCKYNSKEKLNYIKRIKKDSGRIIITNLGIKILSLSLIYSFFNSSFLLKISGFLYKEKSKKRNM